MDYKRGVRLLVLASVLWSFSGVCIKLMDWNGYAVAGMRSLIAAGVLLLWLRRPRLPQNRWQWAAALSYAGLVVLMVVSTKRTTAANAILLQYTAPIYSAALGYWLLREPVRRRDAASIALILVGLAVFLCDGLAGGRMSGNLLALLSGVCYGAMNVFMRMGGAAAPGINVFWGNLLAFFLMLPFFGHMEMDARNVGIVLFLGVFQLGLAYVLYAAAIPHVPALSATIITVLEPILNPVWVMLFYGERPSVWTVTGGALVLLAIVLRSVRDRPQT